MWHRRPGTVLIEPGDVRFWTDTLWKTDAFRALIADPRTGYRRMLEKAAMRPWWFVDPVHDYERAHFSIWFAQAFLRRTYANPVIEDLYYWHDLLHALTFPPDDSGSLADWMRRMRTNESEVSLETEVVVYLRQPALRAQTFDFPIWADRLIGGWPKDADERVAAFRAACAADPELGASERALWAAHADWPLGMPPGLDARALWDWRRAVALAPTAGDPVEEGIAFYEGATAAFYRTWAHDWREAETERDAFERACAAGDWRGAVKRREALWERVSDEGGVPYGGIARR